MVFLIDTCQLRGKQLYSEDVILTTDQRDDRKQYYEACVVNNFDK